MTSGVIADSIVQPLRRHRAWLAMMTSIRRDPRSPLTKRLLIRSA